MNGMKKLIFILSIIFFGIILVYAVKEYSIKGDAKSSIRISEHGIPFKEEWMGIYIGEQKIGYSYTLTQKSEDGGYIITERTKMVIKLLGEEKKIETFIKSYATEDYAMKSFIFEFPQPTHPMKIEGEVVGSLLKTKIYTGGEVRTEEILLGEDTYLPVSIEGIVVKCGLKEGSRYEFPVFDPSTFSKVNLVINVGGKEKLTIGGKEYEANKLETNFSGIISYIWVTEEGEVLKEVSPMGVSMIKESREEALKTEAKEMLLEIIAYYSIPSSVKIKSPQKTQYLKVELDGIDDLSSLDIEDERQRILSKEPLCVEIVNRPTVNSHEPTAEDLSSTPMIQANDRLIKETAQKVMNHKKTDSLKVEALLKWMCENIEKRPTPSLPSAIDVLKTKEGDCGEHSVLFCALARAEGIPARVCLGVMYHNGLFSYHAWNKVFLGEWVAVDPVFNQFPCDATHIKLAEGEMDRQILLANIIGKLKIKVIEYR